LTIFEISSNWSSDAVYRAQRFSLREVRREIYRFVGLSRLLAVIFSSNVILADRRDVELSLEGVSGTLEKGQGGAPVSEEVEPGSGDVSGSRRMTRRLLKGIRPVPNHPDLIFDSVNALGRAIRYASAHSNFLMVGTPYRIILSISFVIALFSELNTPTSRG